MPRPSRSSTGATRHAWFRYLYRNVGNHAAANDLMQDVWFAVARSAERYRPSAKFSTWLFTLAHNRMIDTLRARRPSQSLDSGEETNVAETLMANERHEPFAEVQSQEEAAALLDAVSALPRQQREAFLLQAEGDLSVEEIASATGTSFETVKSRLRYARTKLRQLLRGLRVSTPGPEQDEEQQLLERYRQASNAQPLAPNRAVADAILAEARRAAAARIVPRRRRWILPLFGGVAAASLAGLLVVPKMLEHQEPRISAAPADLPAAAPTAAPSAALPPTATAQAAENAGAALGMKPPSAAESVLSAVASGDLSRVQRSLDAGEVAGDTIDARDIQGRSALLLAVMANRRDMVRLLLAHGADPNAADHAGNTPVQQARRADDQEMLRILDSNR